MMTSCSTGDDTSNHPQRYIPPTPPPQGNESSSSRRNQRREEWIPPPMMKNGRESNVEWMSVTPPRQATSIPLLPMHTSARSIRIPFRASMNSRPCSVVGPKLPGSFSESAHYPTR